MIVIGLSGYAGSGKDLFFKLFNQVLLEKGFVKPTRFALADALKGEVRQWILNNYKIDIFNCSREDKEKVRDFLVFHGNFKRGESKGKHWTGLVEKGIIELIEGSGTDKQIICVTDIRYDEYPEDERWWLQQKLGGILVHISQFEIKKDTDGPYKSFLTAPNKFEELNDPILKNKANAFIEWEKVPPWENEDFPALLRGQVEQFAEWLISNNVLTNEYRS